MTAHDVTILGGDSIAIDAQGGDIARDILNVGTGANNTTIKGLTFKNTGKRAIDLQGTGLSGITIEDVTILHENGKTY